jgi:hypothetical protein
MLTKSRKKLNVLEWEIVVVSYFEMIKIYAKNKKSATSFLFAALFLPQFRFK